ncbi:Uncharacterised protein [Mycobacteroides abscessus subsp. abscessus]|nr:Uncharacterised protein [Mycobacteroides abscessus subsp. abscessus]
MGNGVPSGSRGAVFTTAGSPLGQRYETSSIPRGARPNCAVTAAISSSEITGAAPGVRAERRAVG